MADRFPQKDEKKQEAEMKLKGIYIPGSEYGVLMLLLCSFKVEVVEFSFLGNFEFWCRCDNGLVIVQLAYRPFVALLGTYLR